MRNGAGVPGRNFEIDITIPPGIDDRRFSCITDDIRVVSKTFGNYPFEQHAFSPCVGIHLRLVKRLG
jgi:hypothetical protein